MKDKLEKLKPLPVGAKIRVARKTWVKNQGWEFVPREYVVGTILPDGTLDGGCGCCGDALSRYDEVEVLE